MNGTLPLPATAAEFENQPHVRSKMKELEALTRDRTDEKNAPIEEELHL